MDNIVPESYLEWRRSQGFDDEAIFFLYNQIDSQNLDRINIFLDTQRTDNKYNFDINIAVEKVNQAGSRIVKRNDKKTTEFMLGMSSTVSEFKHAFDLAMYGNYDSCLILMRASFESLFRMIIGGVKAKEDVFENILERKSWPTKIGKKERNWDDALLVDRALGMFEMCVIMDKMNLTYPIKNTYDFLKIKELNPYVHRNMPQILNSEHFQMNTRFKYDRGKIELCSKYYFLYIEIWLIVMQNVSDTINMYLLPLVDQSKDLKKFFPEYTKLLSNRVLK